VSLFVVVPRFTRLGELLRGYEKNLTQINPHSTIAFQRIHSQCFPECARIKPATSTQPDIET
jgi:hypothetical protein